MGAVERAGMAFAKGFIAGRERITKQLLRFRQTAYVEVSHAYSVPTVEGLGMRLS